MINNKIQLDSAFIDANIITMDGNTIIQGGIGCFNGEIIALDSSENILDMCGHNTEIHRLEGHFITPGFIDSHRLLYEELFSPYFFKIDETWDLDSIAQEIDYFIIENFNTDFVFGYGFSTNLLETYSKEEIESNLNDLTESSTIILLSEDENHLIFNTKGREVIDSNRVRHDNLSEEDLLKLSDVLDFDYQDLKDQLYNISFAACECGITSIQNSMCPKLFQLAMQKILNNPRDFKTRIIDDNSIFLTDLKILHLAEMSHDDFIQSIGDATHIKLVIKSEQTIAQIEPLFNNLEGLKHLVKVSIYTDLKIPDSIFNKHSFDIIKTWNYSKETSRVIEHSANGYQAVNYLTKTASVLMDNRYKLGCIKLGNSADLAIFQNNPLQLSTKDFNKLLAEITIIDGNIVYNKEEDKLSKEFDMMINQLI